MNKRKYLLKRAFTPLPVKPRFLARGAGFTLVEVLVCVFIVSVIVAAIFGVLSVGNMSWFSNSGLLDLQQDGRLAMYRIVGELRQSKASDITISNNGSQVSFKIPLDISEDPVTYSGTITYYTNNSNQIIREHPAGTTKIVANNINTLSFCCWHSDGSCDTSCSNSDMLKVEIEAAKTQRGRGLSFSLKEEVRLRNEF